MSPRTFAILAVAAVSSACMRRAPETPAPAISDANIAAIVVTANTIDIQYADMALAKSQTAAVREFAEMVKKDHQSVNEAAGALVSRLGVTPEMNTVAFDLRDDAEVKRLTLRDFEGAAFDSAYAANEVTYHTTVLGAIDNALIPSAQNAELKALLVAVRPAVAAHLEHARELVGKVGRR
jgi:putative membrane protein